MILSAFLQVLGFQSQQSPSLEAEGGNPEAWANPAFADILRNVSAQPDANRPEEMDDLSAPVTTETTASKGTKATGIVAEREPLVKAHDTSEHAPEVALDRREDALSTTASRPEVQASTPALRVADTESAHALRQDEEASSHLRISDEVVEVPDPNTPVQRPQQAPIPRQAGSPPRSADSAPVVAGEAPALGARPLRPASIPTEIGGPGPMVPSADAPRRASEVLDSSGPNRTALEGAPITEDETVTPGFASDRPGVQAEQEVRSSDPRGDILAMRTADRAASGSAAAFQMPRAEHSVSAFSTEGNTENRNDGGLPPSPAPSQTEQAARPSLLDADEALPSVEATTRPPASGLSALPLAQSESASVARVVLDRIFKQIAESSSPFRLDVARDDSTVSEPAELDSERVDLHTPSASDAASIGHRMAKTLAADADGVGLPSADAAPTNGVEPLKVTVNPSVPAEIPTPQGTDVHRSETGTPQAAGGEFRAPSRPEEWAPWFQALLRRPAELHRSKDGTSTLRLQLDENAHSMTIRTRNDGAYMAVTVGFTDPGLQASAVSRVEEIRSALQALFDLSVDLTFSHEDAGFGRERASGHADHGQPGAHGTASEVVQATGDDLLSETRQSYLRLVGSNREWVG